MELQRFKDKVWLSSPTMYEEEQKYVKEPLDMLYEEKEQIFIDRNLEYGS